MSPPNLLLDALSLVCIVAFLLSGLVAVLPRPAGDARSQAREARRRLFLPLAGALTAVGLGFWPALRAALGGPPDHCLTLPSHHPHLCWIHPRPGVGAAHDAVVILALLMLGGLVIWQAYLWAQTRGRLELLHMVSRPNREAEVRRRLSEGGMVWPGDIQVIALGMPLCFVHGLRRPRLVLSEPLLDSLSDLDVHAIVAHELAHVRRRDNWWRAMGQLATLMHLPGLGRVAYDRWSEATEAACDQEASLRLGSPLPVAEALVRFQRLMTMQGGTAALAHAGAAFAPPGGLEVRVRALLAATSHRPSPMQHWPWLMLVLAVWQAELLHQSLEWLLELIHF